MKTRQRNAELKTLKSREASDCVKRVPHLLALFPHAASLAGEELKEGGRMYSREKGWITSITMCHGAANSKVLA